MEISQALIDSIQDKVVTSIATTTILFLLSLLFKSVRGVVFFKAFEFTLDYESKFGKCEWDIKWENFLLTIQVPAMHDDHMPNVTVKINAENLGQEFKAIRVSESFQDVEHFPLKLRIKNIVRTNPDGSDKSYKIYLIVRRRRFFA